jgi:hypothetical protein
MMALNDQSLESDNALLPKSNHTIDSSKTFTLCNFNSFEYAYISIMHLKSVSSLPPLENVTLDIQYPDDEDDLSDSIHLTKDRLLRKKHFKFESCYVEKPNDNLSSDMATMTGERRHQCAKSSLMTPKDTINLSSVSNS